MNVVAATRTKAWPKAAILLVAALLVAFLAFRQVHRLTATPMWVADAPLAPGTRISSGDLKLVRESKSSLPEGVLLDRGEIEGQVIYRPKAAGRPFFPGDFTRPARPAPTPLATIVPEGRVLTTVKITQTSVPYPQLRMGDRLELVAVGRAGGAGSKAHVVASNVFLIGSLAPGSRPAAAAKSRLGASVSPPKQQKKGTGGGGLSLILALRPEDVLPVAEAQASEAPITVVLHGQNEVRKGELLDLRTAGPKVVELLVGGEREEVTFPL